MGAIQIVALISNVPTERKNHLVLFYQPYVPTGRLVKFSSRRDVWLAAWKSNHR